MRKKRIVMSAIFLMIFALFTSTCFAANGYDFEINFTGEIKVNEEKAGSVVLVGDGTGTDYTNVRVKVDITGPSTPKLLAQDTNGTQIDIAQVGYWGPEAGFPITKSVRNETPMKAIFDKAGEYKITVSLIDKTNADAVITSKEVTLDVKEDTPVNQVTNQINNVVANEIVNNVTGDIEELPKTGASVSEIILYTIAIVGIFMFAIFRIRNQNN